MQGGRPVIYILTDSKQISDSCGGNDLCFQAGVKKFRADLVNRQLKTPYIVIMDFDAADGKRLMDRVHADAISSYTTQGNAPEGSSFAAKAAGQQWFWNQCKETGAQVVPIVSWALAERRELRILFHGRNGKSKE